MHSERFRIMTFASVFERFKASSFSVRKDAQRVKKKSVLGWRNRSKSEFITFLASFSIDFLGNQQRRLQRPKHMTAELPTISHKCEVSEHIKWWSCDQGEDGVTFVLYWFYILKIGIYFTEVLFLLSFILSHTSPHVVNKSNFVCRTVSYLSNNPQIS